MTRKGRDFHVGNFLPAKPITPAAPRLGMGIKLSTPALAFAGSTPPTRGQGQPIQSAAAVLIPSHAFLLSLALPACVQPRSAAIQPLNVREGVT